MIALVVSITMLVSVGENSSSAHWWDAEVDASLDRAPDRKDDWSRWMKGIEGEQQAGAAYLIRFLPIKDLESLPIEALARNLELAYQARSEVAWGEDLPEDIFLDAVLPHASVTEPRDSMRAEFRDRYVPLVRDCTSPGEAALRINAALFTDYEVVYNTRRLRTDQCSRESIAQGMATCTGLSIMLVEACRAAGVPARVAGIASWPGRGGNHTWVEVWDDGWHFVGAAEPDERGLDHAWFVGDAATALPDEPLNAIYAATYRVTGEHFPLAWDRRAQVPGENVTRRYLSGEPTTDEPPRLMVEVRRSGERVVADVLVLDRQDGSTRLEGASFGPGIDLNRHLTCRAPEGREVLVIARHEGRTAVSPATVQGDTIVRLDLDAPMDDLPNETIATILEDRFGPDESRRELARQLLSQVPWQDSIRRLAWEAYRSSTAHESLRDEFDSNRVETPDRLSPYRWRHVGEEPEGGWALVIAMHGGGGTATHVNDAQWNSMFERYYNDHPEAGGYVYLALRAPNDEWNGFYDDAICPLVERLIKQFVLFADVNPDKVSILGASHGGYGAFVIGPKIPHRFAAVHASASAPTPGETQGENLRNVPFTFMVGERDTAYGRAERCQAFAQQLEHWRSQFGGYVGGLEFLPDVGHSVPDRDKVAELLAVSREPRPDRLVWVQSDDVVKDHYWIEDLRPGDSNRLEASVASNTITIHAESSRSLALWLDVPLIDPARSVTIKAGRNTLTCLVRPDVESYCAGLESRGDSRLAAPIRLLVEHEP